MKIEKIKKRVNELISLSDRVLATSRSSEWGNSVNEELFREFRSASLSFIRNTFGEEHPFYTEFDSETNSITPYNTTEGKGILKAVKSEIDGGWHFKLKDLVSAEIFSDFLEMAEYLLTENYKDAAAVMTGSVLEEHLRQLCVKNSIDTETTKNGRQIHKKADLLNSELTKANAYNKIDQKLVTSWLGIRNDAAHGNYTEYTKEQVSIMYQGVLNFIART
jgi:hypothetical protein